MSVNETIKISKIFEYNVEKQSLTPVTANLPQDLQSKLNSYGCLIPPIDKNAIAQLSYLDPTHRACIDMKTLLVGGIGYEFLAEDSAEKEKFLKFIEKPNLLPNQTFSQILRAFVSDVETFDEAYTEFIKAGEDKFAIYQVNSKDIYIKPKLFNSRFRAGFVEGFKQITNTKQEADFLCFPHNSEELKPNKHYLYQFKNYNPLSSFYGVPRYLASYSAILENLLIRKHGIAFFANDARPSAAIIISGGSMGKNSERILTDTLKNNFKGTENAHRLLVIQVDQPGAKIEIKELSKTLDGNFLKESEKNRDEIIRVHEMPPKILGVATAGSLGSGSETIGSLKDMQEKTINPRQRAIEDYFNNLFLVGMGYNPKLKLKSIDLTNKKDDAVIISLLTKLKDENGNPVMSISEARKLFGGLSEKATDLGASDNQKNDNPNSDGDSRVGDNTEADKDAIEDVSVDQNE